METFSLEVWKPNPDKPGYLKHERNRNRGEVKQAIENELKRLDLLRHVYWIATGGTWINKEIPSYLYPVISWRQGPNEGWKVEVGVVYKNPENKKKLEYYSIVVMKLFDKEKSKEITNHLTEFLEACG